MKKYICLLLVLLFIFTFTGCKSNKLGGTTSSQNGVSEEQKDTYYNSFENFEETFTAITVKEKNHIIKTSDKFAGDFYEIYDNNGNLLDKGYHGWRGSFDISKKDEVIVLEYGFGGTSVHPKYRFYDAEKGIASRYFEGPIAYSGQLVAYFSINENNAKLIVQDIFNIEETYIEFSGKFDKFILMKIQEMSFNEDGTKILIRHCETNNESNIIEETFVLN